MYSLSRPPPSAPPLILMVRKYPDTLEPAVFSNPDMSMNGLVEEPEGGAKVRVDGGNDCGVGGAGGQDAATREASRGGGGTDHAAGFSALATSRKSALRARWTSWAASRSVAACAAASSCSKVMPGFRKPSAPGSDLSFS